MEQNVLRLPQSDDSIDYFDMADIRSAMDFDIEAARPSLVKGMLLERQVSLLCGPPNLGKTSVAASIAAHIARGEDMGTRRVRKGGVFYIAAEDPTGVLERAYPFMNGSAATFNDFLVSSTPIDLRQDSVIDGFIRGLNRWKEQAGHERILVVFDTLNLSVGDGDENSARDMSRAMSNAQRIAARTAAHVMIVAHVALADENRPRGSSALSGNCDTILVLQRLGDEEAELSVVQAVPKKQRSIPRATTFAFEIAAHPVCHDEDGDFVTVAKAVPLDRDSEILVSMRVSKEEKAKRDLKAERAAEVLKCLEDIAREQGVGSVSKQAIKDRCKNNPTGPFKAVLGNQSSFEKKFRESLSALVIGGRVKSVGTDEFAKVEASKPDPRAQEEDGEVIERDDPA